MEACKAQVKEDCERLLSLFQQTDSVRFEMFSKLWREMNFSQIFYGTKDRVETRAFTRQILAMVYKYFLPPFTFQIRVGGLYLLYGLYSTQLAEPREQIHLALKDWEVVKKFEKDAAEAQHFDSIYILRKLLSQKAFRFSATPFLLTYSVKRSVSVQSVCEDFVERTSRPQELASSDLLEELSNIHEHYERQKAAMSSRPEHNLVQKELLPRIRDAIRDFGAWQRNRGAEEDADEGTSSQRESSSRAELLASIKSRSYGEVAEACKSRRHRQVELRQGGAQDQTTPTRTGKQSLKMRSSRKIQSRGDLMKDTLQSTNIWRLTSSDSEPADVQTKRVSFKR